MGSLSVAPAMEYLQSNGNQLIVINTHHHWDHVWGNHAFTECTIISHQLCRERIAAKWDKMMARNGRFAAGNVVKNLQNLVFEDMLFFPDDKMRLFYTPGHTVDSISVLDEEEGILNVGDNMGDTMDEIVPSLETEKGSHIKTLSRYKEMDVRACVSGHNKVLNNEVFDMILKLLD